MIVSYKKYIILLHEKENVREVKILRDFITYIYAIRNDEMLYNIMLYNAI